MIPTAHIERDEKYPTILRLLGDRAELLSWHRFVEDYCQTADDVRSGSLDAWDAPAWQYYVIGPDIDAVPTRVELEARQPLGDFTGGANVYLMASTENGTQELRGADGQPLFFHYTPADC
ncbi:hypothetical protein ACWDTT_15925 [Streptosporangium sandarakinum]